MIPLSEFGPWATAGIDDLQLPPIQVDALDLAPMDIDPLDELPPPEFPWPQIEALTLPEHQEQLSSLAAIVSSQDLALTEGPGHTLLSFALGLAQQVESSYFMMRSAQNPFTTGERRHQQERALRHLVRNGQLVIGKLIYLCNRSAADAAALLTPSDPQQSLAGIHHAFDADPHGFSRIDQQLGELSRRVAGTDLHDVERLIDTRLPVELSKLLMNRDGTVNFGVIPAVKHWLRDVHGKDKTERRHNNLYYGLKILGKSSELRELLASIQAPERADAQGASIIRATLGIGPKTALRAVHARLTALSGTLSHLRQGRVGSCFATSVCIELMTSDLNRCVLDWKALLEHDYLLRKVNGEEVLCPYLLSLPKDHADTSMRLDAAGLRLDTTGPEEERSLINAPSMIAVSRALGCGRGEFRTLLEAAISRLFRDAETSDKRSKQDSVRVRVEKLLGYLAQEAELVGYIPRGEANRCAEQLVYIFEAQTQHPLLRAWENCIAGMAEVELESYVKEKISSCVLKVCRDALQTQFQHQDELLDQVMNRILEVVNERSRPQYDPGFAHDAPGADGRSVRGAYVLYDARDRTLPRSWQRIDTPQAYQRFFTLCLEEAQRRIHALQLDQGKRSSIDAGFHLLQKLTAEGSFIKLTLRQYPGAKLTDDPLNDYRSIKHSPWVDKCGNFSRQTLKTYFELDSKPHRPLFRPYRAEHLLTRLIESVKGAPQDVQEALQHNRYYLLPVGTSGQHAFSLTLGGPHLRSCLD